MGTLLEAWSAYVERLSEFFLFSPQIAGDRSWEGMAMKKNQGKSPLLLRRSRERPGGQTLAAAVVRSPPHLFLLPRRRRRARPSEARSSQAAVGPPFVLARERFGAGQSAGTGCRAGGRVRRLCGSWALSAAASWRRGDGRPHGGGGALSGRAGPCCRRRWWCSLGVVWSVLQAAVRPALALGGEGRGRSPLPWHRLLGLTAQLRWWTPPSSARVEAATSWWWCTLDGRWWRRSGSAPALMGVPFSGAGCARPGLRTAAPTSALGWWGWRHISDESGGRASRILAGSIFCSASRA